MSLYPTNPVTHISDKGGVPITQQPISGFSNGNNYSEMPQPVMGGGNPVVPIPEGYPPLCTMQLQPQPQPQIGFAPYPPSSATGQRIQFYNGPGQPQPQMGSYPPQSFQQPQQASYIGMGAPNSIPQQQPMFQPQGQPTEEGGFVKMAGSLLNQLNPNAFAHSGIPGIARPPENPPIMPLPPRAGIPLGLELLADMDEIIVKQKAEFLEIMTGYETANRYNVLNSKGERIYFAGESTETGALCCGGPHRPFQITIVDFSGRTVLLLERPCDWPLYISNCWICCCCWLGIIGGKVFVKLADGTLLGEVTHSFGFYRPKFELRDAEGNLVMQIRGRHCGDCCLCQNGMDQCCSTEFPVAMSDGTPLGSIKKKWGAFRELLTDADTFGVNFPLDLDVKWKALIFGAVFLLDFMYYEQQTQRAM